MVDIHKLYRIEKKVASVPVFHDQQEVTSSEYADIEDNTEWGNNENLQTMPLDI